MSYFSVTSDGKTGIKRHQFKYICIFGLGDISLWESMVYLLGKCSALITNDLHSMVYSQTHRAQSSARAFIRSAA